MRTPNLKLSSSNKCKHRFSAIYWQLNARQVAIGVGTPTAFAFGDGQVFEGDVGSDPGRRRW